MTPLLGQDVGLVVIRASQPQVLRLRPLGFAQDDTLVGDVSFGHASIAKMQVLRLRCAPLRMTDVERDFGRQDC